MRHLQIQLIKKMNEREERIVMREGNLTIIGISLGTQTMTSSHQATLSTQTNI